MIDFHIHPDFSIDSKASVEAIVHKATVLGLSEICFTTHIDLNPKRIGLDRFMRVNGNLEFLKNRIVMDYIDTIRFISQKLLSPQILLGFEFSYSEHFASLVKEFIEKYKPDFHLGAVHCLDNIGITSRREACGYYRSVSVERAIADYISAMDDLIDSGLFPTIAHFDGIKKYGRAFYGDELEELFAVEAALLFEKMADLHIGIEINTSAMRRGFSEPYPSRRLLKIARDKGVQINSVGSDAHRPKEVGFELATAYSLIEELGLSVGKPLADYL
ncbi:histidinol-phosphatase HisJ family protein [bacterium]|nr:histidinol-phosphatase HisJ family protein [bacterium]